MPANYSCPSPAPAGGWRWHHGIDLADSTTYPNGVGCTDSMYGPGTTIYAGRAGTVARIVTGEFAINLPGTNTYINLVHEQGVFDGLAVGSPVQLGQRLVMVGNIGYSDGCHLHFEVDIGNPVPGWYGSGYDVDPTAYLFPVQARLDVFATGS